ncbi:MAG: RagB/SusD family nutrient uptake outer membrane protein [Prevotellaceae bacterium]|nr:RagB/SusD family nutrient uptake outer membrane protein [Prevotellaceae bacterium]
MKKSFNIFRNLFAIAVIAITATSCSDEFLQEKRPYGSFGPEEVYGDWNAVNLRLNFIYQKNLPYFKGEDNSYPDMWPVGYADNLSNNTEEFTGYGHYNNPTHAEWTNENIDKYFFYGINESPWKKIRECNDVIVRVQETELSNLTQEQKDEVEAQARFFRATRYFRLFKRFGGVPITEKLQSTLMSDSLENRLVRETTDSTYRFIINDLVWSGDILPAVWDEEVNNWGRVTAGTCYALAGVVANYYASPIFNRADELSRWQEAYDLNKKALEVLAEGGFGLAFAGDPGSNASNWAKIWCNMKVGDGNISEGVYMAICNNQPDQDGKSQHAIPNGWEKAIRPNTAKGSGSLTPSAEMIDLFPMADGKRPTEAGQYQYDKDLFFLNRDPRFYRTFAFPGTEWKFKGTISDEEYPYISGTDYKLLNFSWFQSVAESQDTVKSGFFSDLMGSSGKSIFVRKKSQDYGIETNALYNFSNDDGFTYNGQPLLAMRYTEVLLNFAESACGINRLDEAWDALVKIRQRVGYTGDCGLDPAIKSDRARMFEAILFERQIELAYEGKRFDDCHRWMLFDGGVGQEELSPTWKVTAWSGNTCKYLGVKPLNEVLRHRIELHISPLVYIGERDKTADPFVARDEQTPARLTYPEALSLMEDFRTVAPLTEDGTITFNNDKVRALAEFYKQYIVRKDVSTMANEPNVETITDDAGNETTITTDRTYPIWPKNLYFLGLGTGDQNNNPSVQQTLGWTDAFGGVGTFDPLAK